jgi:hypothetical protein
MGFYYVPKRIMKDIDCSENKELCTMILKHDPKMISQMVKYDFEVVKPLIDKSLTYLNRADLRAAVTPSELSKILVYGYEKSSKFRKDVMDMFFKLIHIDSKKEKNYWLRYDIDSADVSAFKKVAERILTENPMYLIFVNDKVIKKSFKYLGIDYKKTVKSINFKKLYNKVEKALSREDSRFNYNPKNKVDLAINLLGKNDVHFAYWTTNDYVVNSENLEEKISSMIEDFPEITEISSIFLLIKMK